ncbi:Ger(x)C family spore germination protein [Paenibacillus glucanolyticus]|jgi:spore germination protein KC|uniref:Ger(x)C family spore germination protein n=1 Tax=Paenibacillus TaxID=44249 RepID=UPI0003E1E364|nr:MULTISPECIES: Ger(x)C family spore germination protein [Paenibacillus]ANA82410.1 spore gernimation protein GerC [Paenibacillus glucanolyticus]AVV58851.1 Ger(x)C family spore germination protein [Paenibacillus glucanolyticus]ETT41512.1 Ger(x)C family germination protein [Paenibacillus sp. FSL R5-808]MPY17185.1 Ger(x)C family spore germination protein [Paenibacillus glucanolyticus]OMF80198.1 spore gernimation protein GerC [Paenibacillus glucanolyticus]
MLGRTILSVLLMTSLIITSGCWSRKELNELAVVMALGIDTHKDGYAVSAQVLNSSELATKSGGSIGSLPVVTYKSVGKTVPDALQRMLSMAPRMLYLSHVRVLVLGEDLARQGVSDVLDYISRNHQLRTNFFMLIAKNGNASEILEVVTPFEYIPANSLYSSILISEKKWAATGKVTLQQFVNELKQSGSDPILSGVQLNGSSAEGQSVENVKKISPSTLLQHAGLGVFKGDRLVGWLGEPPSKTVNYVLNRVESTAGYVSCPSGGIVGFTVNRADTSLDVMLSAENIPRFSVKMEIEADINSVQCPININQPSAIEALERSIEDKYNENIEKHVKDVQQRYGADIFALGEVLHRKYPQVWKTYRSHWGESFQSMSIDVHSHVAIRRIGSIIQPLNQEVDEK